MRHAHQELKRVAERRLPHRQGVSGGATWRCVTVGYSICESVSQGEEGHRGQSPPPVQGGERVHYLQSATKRIHRCVQEQNTAAHTAASCAVHRSTEKNKRDLWQLKETHTEWTDVAVGLSTCVGRWYLHLLWRGINRYTNPRLLGGHCYSKNKRSTTACNISLDFQFWG